MQTLGIILAIIVWLAVSWGPFPLFYRHFKDKTTPFVVGGFVFGALGTLAAVVILIIFGVVPTN